MNQQATEVVDDVNIPDDDQNIIEHKQEEQLPESGPKFISRDDWIASGKDPDDWRSPREFRERGELIESNKALRHTVERLKVDTDNQIKNLNTYHEIRLKNELNELISKRDDAIDVADKAEVRRIDAQIAENEKQSELIKAEPVQQEQIKPEIIEFMQENTWAQDANDERTKYAQSIINKAMDVDNKTLAYALRLAEREVSKKFSNPQKRTGPMVEGSRTAGGVKQSSGTPTWSQLTAEEEKQYVPAMWKSEDAFLKAVANARKGSK